MCVMLHVYKDWKSKLLQIGKQLKCEGKQQKKRGGGRERKIKRDLGRQGEVNYTERDRETETERGREKSVIMVECKLMCVSGLGSHVLIDVSLEWRHWLHSPTRQTRHTVVGKSEQKTLLMRC